jgi:hypothetical protein
MLWIGLVLSPELSILIDHVFPSMAGLTPEGDRYTLPGFFALSSVLLFSADPLFKVVSSLKLSDSGRLFCCCIMEG